MNCLQTLYLGEGSSAFEMFYECQMAGSRRHRKRFPESGYRHRNLAVFG